MIDLAGRVVIVTGAGRGLGAAYASYLAQRGAHVVVNDVGCAPSGEGRDPTVAAGVADSINRAGGTAVASAHDVRDLQACDDVVATALSRFGRIDAVVHNAGLNVQVDFADTSPAEVGRQLAVDPLAAFQLTQAAWPLLVEQGYGRLVFTVSGAMLGLPRVAAYGTAKGATWSLARCLASVAPAGIKVNAISPVAFTRMTMNGSSFTVEELEARRVAHSPEAVAPLVAVLVDERCPSNGELFGVGGGLVSRIFVAETAGYGSRELSPDGILDHWDTIMTTGATCTAVDVGEQPRRFVARMPAP